MINHLPLFLLKTKRMDVRHYFEPVDFLKFPNSGLLNKKDTLGAGIEKTTNTYFSEKPGQIDIALLGIPFDSRLKGDISCVPDKIREELYQLSRINRNLKIADFGNLKSSKSQKENYRALRDLVEYFKEQNITLIILGGSQDLTIGICEAFHNDPFFSLSVIDSRLDVKTGKDPLTSKNYLSHIFKLNPEIFQFNLIGYQSYFVPQEYFSKIMGINQHIRLGFLRENMTLIEPLFRNCDAVSFDIGSVKNTNSHESNIISPNGLRSEEACQLSKYAGIAGRVKVFGLFEITPDKDVSPAIVKLASQIIWYFIEGFSNRQSLNNYSIEMNTVYKVEVENIDNPLIFLRDKQTGQWWMEIKTVDNGKRYFACSEQEYFQASNNEIPELWLKYVQKTDEILK